MQRPVEHPNESERLERLYQLDVLDTPAEGLYDDITRLAAMFCNTTFSTISLVDRDRQWFKSQSGPLHLEETPREVSFCGHALLRREIFVIEDALSDERFRDNPLVTGGPLIRFYAGAPLITSDGLPLGTLCVFDPRPGQLDEGKKEALTLLARQVTDRLENRFETTQASLVGKILDASDLYVAMLDVRRNFVAYTNQTFRRRMGEPEYSARQLFQRMLPELDYEGLAGDPGDAEARERLLQTTVHFSPGDQLKTDVRLMTITEKGRRVLLLLFRDQSALMASQSEARKARSNLRLFSQLAIQNRNLVIITDNRGRIEWVNPSFEATTGYRLEEIKGRNPGKLLQGPDTSASARQRIRRHVEEGRSVVQEILNYDRHGEAYWTELYIEPIRDEQGRLTHFVSSQSDVTQRKEREQAIREARDAAERANRAKSQFLANISHELRTPLNGIMGVTDLLLNEVDDSLRGYMDTLSHSSHHLLRILNDVLDLSHIESGHFTLHPAPFNAMQVLSEVEHLFGPQAEAGGISLNLTTSGLDGLILLGDATRLSQVLMNLVNNAVKFTPAGGKVTLQATARGQADGLQELTVTVSDTGPGIPASEQQRIFGNFEQLDNSSTRAHGGSGLGLAISRQIIRLMGGEIDIESTPGEGAAFSFTVSLPATAGERPATAPEDRPLTPLGEVMVVDDNNVNRTILMSMLQRIGIDEVCCAASAAEALKLLEDRQPDLIFTDIQMPDIDGYGFLERAKLALQAAARPMPVMVACTAETGAAERRNALEAGFDARLGKPVSGGSLAGVLDQLRFRVERPPGRGTAGQKAEAASGSGAQAIDTDALAAEFDNNPDLMWDFLRLFRDNQGVHLDRIDQALSGDDLAGVSDAAHTLRGLVGYFRQPDLTDLTGQLEVALTENRRSLAAPIQDTLKARIAELVAAIDTALASR